MAPVEGGGSPPAGPVDGLVSQSAVVGAPGEARRRAARLRMMRSATVVATAAVAATAIRPLPVFERWGAILSKRAWVAMGMNRLAVPIVRLARVSPRS